MLAIRDELTAAAVMVELDGTVRRLVLFPPDLSREQLATVAQTADADVVVSDELIDVPLDVRLLNTTAIRDAGRELAPACETEWILLTSGTTGSPKLVEHTLASLTGAMNAGAHSGIVWGTFYDIRRYGGLQIFLRAVVAGTPLVLKGAQEGTGDFLYRAAQEGVTHILGTPSHWRSALMTGAADVITPRYVRLSGEVSDQGILNQLRQQYSNAEVVHAFATTEAGVGFTVEDGRMGAPRNILTSNPAVEIKVQDGTLRIRSNRTATRYLNRGIKALKDDDGFVNTGDVVEEREGRLYFAGRKDGIINVGGLKVYPEEVEAVINRHPKVNVSLVKSKKSPIMGSLVVADVMLRNGFENTVELRREILDFCRNELAHHKVPAAIHFITTLQVGAAGKLVRHA